VYVHGDGGGCDLVKRMQLGDNVKIIWIMFDHVNHVEGWMTFAYYVYDSFYYKVTMIAICDMQFEDTKAQCVMWWKLNKVMAKNGVANLNFKGFMVDNA
jgi:hypothetical protein